jgi:hypothetical protein
VHTALWWGDLRSKHRRKGNINMDLQEVGWGDMHLIDLAWNRAKWQVLVSAVMNLWVP